MIEKIINKLECKNIAILGFGREGKSTYQFLRRYLKNKLITIIDENDIRNDSLLDNDKNLQFVIGRNYLENLDIYDVIIKTPGISLKNINADKIKDKLTSQLELLLEVDKENIIGVTGTKGKSTTASLIYEELKNNGRDAYLVGNIGVPIFDKIESYNDKTILVTEMSSHQLEYIKVSPHIGIILNLFEDHLDHAGSVKHYHECKLNMFKFMDESDIAIYCSDNDALNEYIKDNNYILNKISVSKNETSDVYIKDGKVYIKDKDVYDRNSSRNLIGSHNLENIMVALLVSEILKLDIHKSIEAVNNFKPLEHRLELVGTYDGVTYYNDSIATIPDATICSIESLKNVNTLIFGGMDRGIDYSKFIKYLNECNVENLICMPTTGHTIGKLINNKKVYFVETLQEAVSLAKKVTKKRTICILSPAASSYNYFKNFEEKGKMYKSLVQNN